MNIQVYFILKSTRYTLQKKKQLQKTRAFFEREKLKIFDIIQFVNKLQVEFILFKEIMMFLL